MITQTTIDWIINKEKALNEIEELLKEIAQVVEELDGEALLTPAEIEEDDWLAHWEFLNDEDKKEEKFVLNLDGKNEEEDEDFEKDEDEEDDWDEEEEEEERDEDITIGVYLWVPEVNKAVLSIYLEYSGPGDYDENWKRLKQLKSILEGKIHLYHDGWGEETIEVERIALEELAQGKVTPEDIAKKVYSIAKKVSTFLKD